MLFTLLIAAVIGITCGCGFKAAAETGGGAPEDSQVSPQVSPDDDAFLANEATRRLQQLPKQDFKQVLGPVDKPIELDVPIDGESTISLWFATAQGTFAMELLELNQHDSNRQLMVSWQGERRGEQSLVQKLAPGKYVVKLQPIDGARVHGVIGIKRLYSGRCEIGQLTEVRADPAKGYSWPYLLVKPAAPASGVHRPPGADTLLVVPNNTGDPTEDLQIIRAMAKCALTSPDDINAVEIARGLGTPILVPLFPRPDLKEIASNMQLQALTRASLEEIPAGSNLGRVDLQLIAMIDDARKRLADDARKTLATDEVPQVRPQVLIAGLSAAGSFTSRFTVLHPDRVLAAAVVSPGGWPIAPVAADRGKTLRYPVGIADVENLTGILVDLAALRRVRFLFLLGDVDTNDAVGSLDSYSAYDSELIKCRFGKTMLERWRAAKRLYDRAGVRRAQFKVYAGGHAVTPEIRKNIEDTFRAALGAR